MTNFSWNRCPVSNAAAVGANAIGNANLSPEESVLAHAALGCVASAAEGTGCGGGAIGGAVSSVVAPVVRDALYNGTETVTTGTNAAGSPIQITSYNNANINAVTTAIAALAGGAAAGALGQNATAGVTWAENEAVNNTEKHWEEQQLREEMSKLRAHAGLSNKEIIGYDADGNPITVMVPGPPGRPSNVTDTAAQTPFQRGIQFQGDALSILGVPENTQRITVTLPNGSPVTVVPDALDGSTIIEVKDVVNLSNSNQFRGYLATGKPIQLIVSSNTQTISQPLQSLINSSGGSIRIFNPTTGTFSQWTSK